MNVDESIFPQFILNRYSITNLIREGSYGIVYKGIIKKDNIPVAIKVLSNIFHTIQNGIRVYRELKIS